MHKITICMGSSCFARGNKNNLVIIKDFLKKNNLKAEIQMKGILCNGNCGNGPNICINEKWFENISSTVLIDLLEENFLKIENS